VIKSSSKSNLKEGMTKTSSKSNLKDKKEEKNEEKTNENNDDSKPKEEPKPPRDDIEWRPKVIQFPREYGVNAVLEPVQAHPLLVNEVKKEG